jgi:hypothetical protein
VLVRASPGVGVELDALVRHFTSGDETVLHQFGGTLAGMRSLRSYYRWYSFALVIVGMVLVLLTGARAGLILVVGGVVGLFIRWRPFKR